MRPTRFIASSARVGASLKVAVMGITGAMADMLRRLRSLLVMAGAYALVLQPLAMSGATAAQPSPAGILQLCSVGEVSSGDGGSPGHAGYVACCCLAASGGPPLAPPPIWLAIATAEFARIVIKDQSLPGGVHVIARHPSARPRAPPSAEIRA